MSQDAEELVEGGVEFYKNDEMELINEIEAERHDGWCVYRYNTINKRINYTTGERFWDNWATNPNSEEGWIYTGLWE